MKLRVATFLAVALMWNPPAVNASFINGRDDNRKIYQAGELPPLMNDRKPELIPGIIPRRVRYMFADDATVNAAAELLRSRLESNDSALFKDSLLVLPGAFRLLKDTCQLGDGPKIYALVPSKTEKDQSAGETAMSFVKKDEQRASVSKEICRLLKEDGGFEIRSLKTEEMATWWIYIMFDIEEPVYVLAGKNGGHRFVVELNAKNQIAILDELNRLPMPWRKTGN